MKFRVMFAALLVLMFSAPPFLAAQSPQPSAAQEGYVPVDQLPKPQDTLPAAPLLATAYAFVWLLLFGYVFSIWRRLSSVEREMQSVSRRIGPTGGPMP